MDTRSYAAREADVPRGTLCEIFLDAVDRFGAAPAFRHFTGEGDDLADISYDEAFVRAREVAEGLLDLGLQPGDRVALLSQNRPEWALTDYGCLMAGIVDVPIYATLIPEQVAYILRDSGARLVFAEDAEQVVKALEAADLVEQDVRVVSFEAGAGGGAQVMSWDELRERGRRAMDPDEARAFRDRARAVDPADVATILYTSGTTGDPKGVMLTHRNLHSNVWACSHVLPIDADDITLSFLPLSHVFQRMVDYLFLWRGCTIAYARDIRNVAEDLKIVRPTLVVSVPRLYEKVYNRVLETGGFKAKLVKWGLGVARRWADATLEKRTPSLGVRAQYALADRLVYGKIREAVGGRLRFFVSGGAPLEPEINRFFFSVGLPVLEGYGLTETSPVTNVNPIEDIRIGTVGPPVPGTEIRIADDGEILVRGPQVMKGYYNDPEGTARAVDGDGWFHTGDVGELAEDGYLRITDRKKDIIVTAGGKNIAPQPVENRLKTNPFVEQVVMVGDKRKFPALLVVPSFEQLRSWAKERGIELGPPEEAVRDPRVQELMGNEVMEHLGPLSGYETPKKLALLAQEFTIEDGSLTPTQKVKRRVVQDRYRDLIDRFYDESNVDRTVLAEEP